MSRLSSDQQFFLAFAQNWASKVRDGALRQQLLTDSHAPGKYRAETVRNLDGWHKAFDVKPIDKPLRRVCASGNRSWRSVSCPVGSNTGLMIASISGLGFNETRAA
ncbi:M13-type metalloendopeptidase [Edaphobacter sp. HDX4]|uniref:M13-type metalloendopeptidase n=1 Tax=Edaphobacter sp. HDX4 TaxID=2794064 RepID=UPI002FE558CD